MQDKERKQNRQNLLRYNLTPTDVDGKKRQHQNVCGHTSPSSDVT